MTMAFELPNSFPPVGIAVNDRIEGVLMVEDGAMVLTRLRRDGMAAKRRKRAQRD
jgi:hypothetical protein